MTPRATTGPPGDPGGGSGLLGAGVGVRRIQRRRTRGWRMPLDAHGRPAIYVGRPTRWGNPHPAGSDPAAAVAAYTRDLTAGRLPFTIDDARHHLTGRHLACWCPPGQHCHADILLTLTNPPTPAAPPRPREGELMPDTPRTGPPPHEPDTGRAGHRARQPRPAGPIAQGDARGAA